MRSLPHTGIHDGLPQPHVGARGADDDMGILGDGVNGRLVLDITQQDGHVLQGRLPEYDPTKGQKNTIVALHQGCRSGRALDARSPVAAT